MDNVTPIGIVTKRVGVNADVQEQLLEGVDGKHELPAHRVQ
jgi:hypothetical protein